MAAARREDAARRVKEASDLVDWVGRTVRLTKAGQNLEGLCPFHEEKTPSFKVHPERQTFRCFGCGKAGDIFTFVMETERVDFVQALELVAERYGVELGRRGPGSSEGREGRKRQLEVLDWASDVFARWLWSGEGREARDYLRGRGFDDATIREARLGCSPDSWDALLDRARRKGFTPELVERTGLVIRRGDNSGWYDRFRGRVLFPVSDAYGRVVSFGGRVLPGHEQTDGKGDREAPKYVNGPETEVFRKGAILYGLPEARRSGSRRIAVMEGYTDVLLSRQAGVGGVVATLGTALTPEHARQLKRFDVEVVLVYDGDVAGRQASARGVEVLLREDLDVYVAGLPEGLDPADWIRRDGPEALAASLREARSYLDASLDALREWPELATIEGKARAAARVRRLAAVLPNAVKRDVLLHEAAAVIGVEESALRRLDDGAPTPRRIDASTVPRSAVVDAGARAEAELCQGLLASSVVPEGVPNPFDTIDATEFQDDVAREVFRALQSQWWSRHRLDAEEAVLAEERPDVRSRMIAWREEMQARDPRSFLEGGLRYLLRRRTERRLADVRARRRDASREGRDDRLEELLREEQRLLAERDALRSGAVAPAARGGGGEV